MWKTRLVILHCRELRRLQSVTFILEGSGWGYRFQAHITLPALLLRCRIPPSPSSPTYPSPTPCTLPYQSPLTRCQIPCPLQDRYSLMPQLTTPTRHRETLGLAKLPKHLEVGQWGWSYGGTIHHHHSASAFRIVVPSCIFSALGKCCESFSPF